MSLLPVMKNTSNIQTTIYIERDGKEIELSVTGTFVAEQREIRYPNDAAQPGIAAHFEDITATDPSGKEVELCAGDAEWAEEKLFDELESLCCV